MHERVLRWRSLGLTALLSVLVTSLIVFNWSSSVTCPLRHPVPRVRPAIHDPFPDLHDDISRIKPLYAAEQLGFYFYAAYHDTRQVAPYLRILGVFRNGSKLDGFSCKWNSSTGAISQVKASCEAIDQNWPLYNKYFAFMITCPLQGSAPPDVTISRDNYDVILPVHRPRATSKLRHMLAVCVKPMTGSFSVSRVVEWIELHLAAGYENFILYDTDVQGSSQYVFEYYVSKNVATVMRFPFLASVLSMAEKYNSIGDNLRYALYQQVYLVALHDCILRYYSSYKYLAMVDLDEVILPAKNVSIHDVITTAEREVPRAVSYVFYTYWHFAEFSPPTPETPDILYIQKAASAPPPTLDQPKSIVYTSGALTVNWHNVISVLDDAWMARYLLSHNDFGAVHHFRSGQCQEHFRDLCTNMTSSSRPCREVLRYRNVTEINVRKVLEHLQL